MAEAVGSQVVMKSSVWPMKISAQGLAARKSTYADSWLIVSQPAARVFWRHALGCECIRRTLRAALAQSLAQGGGIAPVAVTLVERTSVPKPGGVEQVRPVVLQLEPIPGLHVIRAGLEIAGRGVAVPLGIGDGLDGPLDAAIGVHGKDDGGIATTQPC